MSTLFSHFLRKPGQVGACCPSSRHLCREITFGIGLESAGTVVELGPGTGAITREIFRRISSKTKLVAVELDGEFANELEKEFPRALVCRGCASNLGDMLEAHSLPKADAVISGLPFALFPEDLQDKILTEVAASMVPGGCFSTFAYLQGMMLPAGLRFRRKLNSIFSEVDTGSVVWRNLPPAFIYRCRTHTPGN